MLSVTDLRILCISICRVNNIFLIYCKWQACSTKEVSTLFLIRLIFKHAEKHLNENYLTNKYLRFSTSEYNKETGVMYRILSCHTKIQSM